MRECLTSNIGMVKVSNANVVGLGCIRGLAVGLAFEAAMGLGVYAAWLLWRFLFR